MYFMGVKRIVAHTSGSCGNQNFISCGKSCGFCEIRILTLISWNTTLFRLIRLVCKTPCSIPLSAQYYKCFFKVCNIRKCLRDILTAFRLSYLSMNNILIQICVFWRKSTIWRRECSSLTSKYFAWNHISVWRVFGKIRVIWYLWALKCLHCDYFHNFSFVSAFINVKANEERHLQRTHL